MRACWIAAAGLLACAVCADGPEAHVVDSRSAVFHEMRFDFGKSVQGQRVEHDFVLTNEGTAPLRIEKITLTPPLIATRIPGEIAPGASAAIRTLLDTSRLQGSFSGELVVHGSGQDAPLATLTVEGVVVTPIEIAPMPVFFVMGERKRGAERAIELINHESKPLRIEGGTGSNEAFSTRLETIKPGQHYRLVLKLHPDGPGGKRTDLITLKTSSATTPVLRIPAHTYLRERVYVFPDAVDFGALQLSAVQSNPGLLRMAEQTLMIYQTGGRDFQISVESDVPELEVSYERGPQQDRYQINVALNASRLAERSLQGAIRIRTNDPEIPDVVVPVRGRILDSR